MSDKLNDNDCTVGFSADNTHAIITIPIKKYALNHTDGNALIFGKLKELELHLIGMAEQIRMRQKANGVIQLDGVQPPPNLKAN